MKIFSFLFCLFFSTVIFAQPEYSLHMQKHLPQAAINVNPGSFTDHRINVVLPGVYGGFGNSAFQISDIFQRTSEGQEITLEPAIRKMKDTGNSLRSSFSVHALALTFRTKKDLQFTFFQNTHFDFQLTYPKTLPALLWRGNGAYIGERVDVAPKINVLGYNEYGMGIATRANDKIIVGANFKLVNGFVGVRTEKAETYLTTGAEYYQLTFENDIKLQTAGLTDIFDENEEDVIGDWTPEYIILGGNYGFSVDLGLTYQVSDKLELQFAAQDFGYISWENQVYEQTSEGVYNYDGEIVRPFSDDNDEFDFEQVRDTISDIFEFNSKEKAFLSNFPIKGFVSGSYQIDPTLNLGASLYYEHFADADVSNAALSLHAQKLFGKVFYLGGVAGFHKDEFLFLGANATLQLGPVQLYFITDNMVTLFDPTYGRFTNVRTGLNLSFGRNTKQAKEEEESIIKNPNYFNR